jgi:hypothetical protein
MRISWVWWVVFTFVAGCAIGRLLRWVLDGVINWDGMVALDETDPEQVDQPGGRDA